MALKPLKIRGSHPDQPKPNTQTDRVAASIWPRSYEGEGAALGGQQLSKPADLAPKHLEQHHAVGYATNSGTTPSQERAQVVHTEKHPAKQAPKGAAVPHKGPAPKTAVRTSRRTAPSAHTGEGHRRG